MALLNEHILEAWAAFNREKWKCDAQVRTFESEGVKCQLLFYMLRSRKLTLPPLNPYLPIQLVMPAELKHYRKTNRWLSVANEIADAIIDHGTAADIWLPPAIDDVRPFIWRGLETKVRYTYMLRLPVADMDFSKRTRQSIKSANAKGYISKKCDRMEDVYECLARTESRKQFSYELTAEDLRLVREKLGSEALRCYVCYTSDGEPVSANVTLLFDNEHALAWTAGTKDEHLKHGVAQHVQSFELTDLTERGIRTYDFSGANIPSVAEFKSYWGGELVPYYNVSVPSSKDILRSGRAWLKFNT